MSPAASFLLNTFLALLSDGDNTNRYEFKPHPEAFMTLEQIIKSHGYPLEIHTVESKDNYFTTIYRIPYGRKPDKRKTRSPVLILHGMGGTAEQYTILGTDHALVYYLADRGFDVWLICMRGTSHSSKHRYYQWDKDLKYWDWGLHEVGTYDLPAIIDYTLSKTGQNKTFFIGQSSGTTAFFILGSQLKNYDDKIKIAAHYGPSAILKYLDFPLIRVATKMRGLLENAKRNLGIGHFPPTPLRAIFEVLVEVSVYLCSELTLFAEVCLQIMNFIGSNDSVLANKNITSLAVSSVGTSRVSLKQVMHYLQLIETGFREYDYGPVRNVELYGRKDPPKYNLTNCFARNLLVWGEKDDLTAKKGTMTLLKLLKNSAGYKVPFPIFNHIDFIFAQNASSLVYEPTVKYFKAYDEGKMTRNIANFKLP